MVTFAVPKVKRGRFTNFRTGVFIEFVFNPASIDEKKSSNLVIDAIPGDGEPLIRWASGGPNEISFSLNIDGDARLRKNGFQLYNGAAPELPLEQATTTFSIAGELEFFEQFQYPTDQRTRGGTGEPDLIVFKFGRRYQSTLCIVQDIDIKIIEFDTELNPSKATVDLTLLRRNAVSRFAQFVWEVPTPSAVPKQAVRLPNLTNQDEGGAT